MPTDTITETETTTLHGSTNFIKGVFSDGGEPSSSRMLSFIVSLAVVCILGGVFRHVCRLTDATQLGIWLSNLPYTVNRASGSVSEIISSLRKG